MAKFSKIVVIGLIIGTSLFLIDWAFGIHNSGKIEFTSYHLLQFTYYQLYSILITLVNTYFFEYLSKVEWKHTKYRIGISIIGSILLTMLVVLLIRLFRIIVIEDNSIIEFYDGELQNRVFYLNILRITSVIVIIFHVIYFYQEIQRKKIKEQKIIAGTASAQFDALKNQLDPHFLFNSLNVLTSLIDENPRNAQKFTTALSKVYRYVLEQKSKELVPVDEELRFARTYISLLKMRFEDSIVFDIPEQASNPEAKVVPLSLQLLLENAVKHNIIDANHPLRIKIYEENNSLVVKNNLQIKKILKKSSGVGLENIKQRYQLLTNREVRIDQTADEFAVAIPMLTKLISIMETKNQTEINDTYVRARKHVENLKEFYYSLISYIIVMPFLFFIWYRFTPHVIQWFWFPMFGWGIGLLFHAYKVYVNDGVLGSGWEKKKIEEFMQEEERNYWH